MTWRANGKDLEKAEAVGNAELYVEPVQKTAKNGTQDADGAAIRLRLL